MCLKSNGISLPTNVILGVERTFLVVAMGVLFDLTTGFATLAVDVDVLLELFATDDAPLDAGETTTGSVEGMGFPSLVCNLRTCEQKDHHQQTFRTIIDHHLFLNMHSL